VSFLYIAVSDIQFSVLYYIAAIGAMWSLAAPPVIIFEGSAWVFSIDLLAVILLSLNASFLHRLITSCSLSVSYLNTRQLTEVFHNAHS